MDDLNSTFRIVSLKARNGNLDELGQQLQPSPLRVLDLADNKIESISDGAFANLQNMEEIDLSNNSLVYLGADVFRVSTKTETARQIDIVSFSQFKLICS